MRGGIFAALVVAVAACGSGDGRKRAVECQTDNDCDTCRRPHGNSAEEPRQRSGAFRDDLITRGLANPRVTKIERRRSTDRRRSFCIPSCLKHDPTTVSASKMRL